MLASLHEVTSSSWSRITPLSMPIVHDKGPNCKRRTCDQPADVVLCYATGGICITSCNNNLFTSCPWNEACPHAACGHASLTELQSTQQSGIVCVPLASRCALPTPTTSTSDSGHSAAAASFCTGSLSPPPNGLITAGPRPHQGPPALGTAPLQNSTQESLA